MDKNTEIEIPEEYEDDFEDEQKMDEIKNNNQEVESKKDPPLTKKRVNIASYIESPNIRRYLERMTTETNLVEMPGTSSQSTVGNMAEMKNNINGWNESASKTISNWYNVFREYSYIYQYVLDTNQKMASRLNMISTISSSTLGIFSAFKLWMNDEQQFRVISDIILMMFNFGIAMLTTASKRYLDDARNEKIKMYIEEIDKFVGEISAQLLKMPEYRMNADEFLKKNNDTYTKLITQQPSLTIDELSEGKKLYKKFIVKKPESCSNS
jgi:hypothetical protein